VERRRPDFGQREQTALGCHRVGICRRGLIRIDASTPVPSVDFL
jgi:hypothetical protein